MWRRGRGVDTVSAKNLRFPLISHEMLAWTNLSASSVTTSKKEMKVTLPSDPKNYGNVCAKRLINHFIFPISYAKWRKICVNLSTTTTKANRINRHFGVAFHIVVAIIISVWTTFRASLAIERCVETHSLNLMYRSLRMEGDGISFDKQIVMIDCGVRFELASKSNLVYKCFKVPSLRLENANCL